VVGVEHRCVYRLLQVEAEMNVRQEEVQRPLILLIPTGGAERHVGFSGAQR
jgi:hypothetical protein